MQRNNADMRRCGDVVLRVTRNGSDLDVDVYEDTGGEQWRCEHLGWFSPPEDTVDGAALAALHTACEGWLGRKVAGLLEYGTNGEPVLWNPAGTEHEPPAGSLQPWHDAAWGTVTG